jgi:Fic family protein
MRFPETPPLGLRLEQEIGGDSKRLLQVMRHLVPLQRAVGERYPHWDELLSEPPPEAFTHHDWWWAIKQGRRVARQTVTLTDKQRQVFSFQLTPAMFKALHHIDQRCAGSIAVPEQIATPALRDRYQIQSLMEEAVTSSLLEGAAVTREQAREMLATHRQPRGKGERMIMNNFLTMQKLRTIKDQPLTPKLVLEIHAMISRDALDRPDAAGRLRRGDEPIEIADDEGNVFHIPPPASQLEARMEAMCAFANDQGVTEFLHPVLRAIILHFWLAYDHPFADGNGRTARALFYWSMLRGGYWLFEFISISQALLRAPRDYYQAFLFTETDENDLNYFILHQLKCIETSTEDLHQYLGRKTEERRAYITRLRSLNGLNHRQQALLINALNHPAAVYTFAGHKKSHGISQMTARTDLEGLETVGYLTSMIVGRDRQFRPKEDLETLLQAATASEDRRA